MGCRVLRALGLGGDPNTQKEEHPSNTTPARPFVPRKRSTLQCTCGRSGGAGANMQACMFWPWTAYTPRAIGSGGCAPDGVWAVQRTRPCSHRQDMYKAGRATHCLVLLCAPASGLGRLSSVPSSASGIDIQVSFSEAPKCMEHSINTYITVNIVNKCSTSMP